MAVANSTPVKATKGRAVKPKRPSPGDIATTARASSFADRTERPNHERKLSVTTDNRTLNAQTAESALELIDITVDGLLHVHELVRMVIDNLAEQNSNPAAEALLAGAAALLDRDLENLYRKGELLKGRPDPFH